LVTLVIPSHAPAPAAAPTDFIQGSRWSLQEGEVKGSPQAVAMPTGAIASIAPSHTPPPTADPAGTSLGTPQPEPDSAHLEPNVHQIARAGPGNEVADPNAAMTELE
jgi:hypothetical protein